jgi:hypothetical protein
MQQKKELKGREGQGLDGNSRSRLAAAMIPCSFPGTKAP